MISDCFSIEFVGFTFFRSFTWNLFNKSLSINVLSRGKATYIFFAFKEQKKIQATILRDRR